MPQALKLPTRSEVLSYLDRLPDEHKTLHTIFRDVEASLLIHCDRTDSDEYVVSAELLRVFFDYVERKRHD